MSGLESKRSLWRWVKRTVLGLFMVSLVSVAGLKVADAVRYSDQDAERGAMPIPTADAWGDSFQRVVYLDQGWKPEHSLWFYNTSQGSDLLPYEFMLVLERAQDSTRLLDPANINAYRYLPQKPTSSNPDGLPVGFVKDVYLGKAYLGFTCAACHTGQVNYKGTAIRIDGGPAAADMERFIVDVGAALLATRSDPAKKARFVQAVLGKGGFEGAAQVEEALNLHATRVQTYVRINRSPTPYLHGRLDAFGRIYNRVLEHIISSHDLRLELAKFLSHDEVEQLMPKVHGVLSNQQRASLATELARLLTPQQLDQFIGEFFNPPDAPASYPVLWDIPQHDFVQWNGLAANAGLGPIGRNAGEVIGVFGTLNWTNQERSGLSAWWAADDQQYWVNFQSSVKKHNLVRLEDQLRTLTSPKWPEAILGAIDQQAARRGHRVYQVQCASCHLLLDHRDPKRRVVARMEAVDAVGTDPRLAQNSVSAEGLSGILRGQYVGTGVGDVLLTRRAPAALLLTKADTSVVLTPSPDENFLQGWANQLYDYWVTFSSNSVKPSIKQGTYSPDTTASPYASLQAYKARPLNGVWASAPYLHNGSVPTLYDLLLPAKSDGGSAAAQTRPSSFRVGQREFDPKKVGFRTDQGQLFDTSLPGNSNAGHEYGTRPRTTPNGRVIPALTPEERMDLLEYLKTL